MSLEDVQNEIRRRVATLTTDLNKALQDAEVCRMSFVIMERPSNRVHVKVRQAHPPPSTYSREDIYFDHD